MADSSAGNVGIKISADGSQLRAELLASRKAVEANAAAMQSAASRIQSSANAMTAYGMSAKQTAAAMRGVPAQITDIVTALQGGQRPMTVLFQQGGQLKDMFGGIVPAARALGTTVAGMVNPFTIGAAAAGGLALAYYKGTVESDALTKSLITTGNQAGVTAGQLQLIAQSIGKTTPGVNTSDAMAGLTQMVQAGVVGAQALERYTTAATRLAAVGGQSIEETAKAFSALAQQPVQASSKLNESLNYLTSSVYAQIYALQQQGDTIGAARVAMDAYASASTEMRRNLEGNLGYVERGWNAIKQAADDAWSAMKRAVSDWGRQKTAEEQLSALPNQMAALQEKLRASANLDPSAKKRLQDELSAAQKQQGYLQETVRMQLRAAAGAEDRKVAEQATEKWLSQGTALMDKQQRMQQEITQATNWARDAHKSDAELQQRIADIQAKYADKAKSNVADLNKARRELEAQQQLLAQLNGLSGSFAQDWERLTALYKAGKLSVQQLEGAQSNLLAQQPAMRQMQQAMEAQARAAEQQQRALERAAQATAELKSRTAQANGNNQLADQMALQAELIRYQRAGANVVDLDAYRQAAQAQIAYNDLLRQQQAIFDDLSIKQDALNNLQDSGAISAAQYSVQEHAARLQSAADLQKIVEQMQILATLSGNGDMARAAQAAANAVGKLKTALSKSAQQARDVLENNFTSAFQSFISGTENARTAFAKMTAGILQDIATIAARNALKGTFDTGASWIGSIIDGFKASGGPVSAGGSYIVGEQGPELFVPGASGTIVPNNALRSSGGSAPQINITVNSDGSVQTGGGQGNPEAMAMAYRIAKNAALEVIASQKRPGGMLAA